MQLSPLQSRLAASLVASCILLAIYLLLFSPHFALAAELSGISLDHDLSRESDPWVWEQHMRHDDEEKQDGAADDLELRSPVYEPDFTPFDRSIIGRAPAGVTGMSNNVPINQNINPGSSATFMVEVSSLSSRKDSDGSHGAELRRRAQGEDAQNLPRQTTSNTLWISANTCLQPDNPAPNSTSSGPPQLVLYVSTSSDNTSPGPNADSSKQVSLSFTEGAVMYNTTFTQDVYFTVVAPNVSSTYVSPLYNVEVAASIDQSYHTFDNTSTPNLLWVDSDANATLLRTNDLTSNSTEVITSLPYTIYSYSNADLSVVGVRYSYCGLQEYAQIGGSRSTMPSNMLSTGLTRRGTDNTTKEEFYYSGLNSSTTYEGILVRQPGSDSTLSGRKREANIAGGGGVVYKPTEFSTKSSSTCEIVFNLTFCDQNAYAVPGNPKTFASSTDLANFYDSYAQTMYNNFIKAMMQVSCETSDVAKYSLARDCDDCKEAYKNWVCSVAIPRCEDFSSTSSFLQMRNINAPFPDGTFVNESIRAEFGSVIAYNSSRVPTIDSEVQPGPYKEVLPCADLCYDIVQSCPASLGFGCPTPGVIGFNTSYGEKTTSNDGTVTCNYPGSAHITASISSRTTVSWAFTIAGALAGSLILLAI
ncbi:stretch-activated Ca2+-permeable channel component-domain-containing protein [Xylariales sp. PMI_506]|nr:stretch-activated Ca2+-permeable channel component-domain-containing protein [Xylariales sp. PMI_506]